MSGSPVVHFEVVGTDPSRLRQYYSDLFGWNYDLPSPVASEVSDPSEYGFVDTLKADDGTGIRGGVGGGSGHSPQALFYVGVSNVGEALLRVEQLGGVPALGPVTSPDGLTIAHFHDPEGNLVGLAEVG